MATRRRSSRRTERSRAVGSQPSAKDAEGERFHDGPGFPQNSPLQLSHFAIVADERIERVGRLSTSVGHDGGFAAEESFDHGVGVAAEGEPSSSPRREGPSRCVGSATS